MMNCCVSVKIVKMH